MKGRPMGRREREALEHMRKDHVPTEEQLKRMGSDLRVVGHAFITTARKVEEGDYLEVGRLMLDPAVSRLIEHLLLAKALGEGLYYAIRAADAEDN